MGEVRFLSESMIRAENIGKKYILRHQAGEEQRYVALRDVLVEGARSVGRRLLRRGQAEATTREAFWALKDVSFEIERGATVGVIGRNGAGKSTLLKLLSRITEPTTGRLCLGGRVASLLEVGTGFHPELTGRENIYLNGAILGMSRVEIQRKFDEIVAFAEVERFLDTPVKRYSSGMYVRLAFAVAAHLEPEILVVDEVLAVGDMEFQRKCLGKMEDVATKEGRTVLFVSHNMSAILKLCRQAIWLDAGRLVSHGDVFSVHSQYLAALQNAPMQKANHEGSRTGFLDAWVEDREGVRVSTVDGDYPHKVVVELEVACAAPVNVGFSLINSNEIAVCSTCLWDGDRLGTHLSPGRHEIRFDLPANLLPNDEYRVEGAIWIPGEKSLDQQELLTRFNSTDSFSSSGRENQKPRGQLLLASKWSVRTL